MKMKRKYPGYVIALEGITCCGKDYQAKSLKELLSRFNRHTVVISPEPWEEVPSGKFIRWYIDRKSPEKNKYDFTDIKDDTIKEINNFIGYADTVKSSVKIGLTEKKRLGEECIDNFMEILKRTLAKIKNDCFESLTTGELQVMYVINRWIHIRLFIIPELKKGSVVILVRYYISTLVYGSAFGLPFEISYPWHIHLLGDEFIFPDLYFYLDVLPETSYKRLLESGKTKDQHETKVDNIRKTRDAYLTAIDFLHDEWKKVGEPACVITVDANPPINEVFSSLELAISEKLPELKIAA